MVWSGLQSYEHDYLSEYIQRIGSKLVFARADNEEVRKSLAHNEDIIVGPFHELELWIKQKILELKAFTTSVESLESLITERLKQIERKASVEQKLGYLRQKPGKEREANVMESDLAGLYKEIENLTAIINIVITYKSEIFLPLFKRRQLMLFYRILERFFNSEATKTTKISQAWTSLLTDKNLKHF